jgi:hypothetical protein
MVSLSLSHCKLALPASTISGPSRSKSSSLKHRPNNENTYEAIFHPPAESFFLSLRKPIPCIPVAKVNVLAKHTQNPLPTFHPSRLHPPHEMGEGLAQQCCIWRGGSRLRPPFVIATRKPFSTRIHSYTYSIIGEFEEDDYYYATLQAR